MKRCEYCNKEFKPIRETKKFCSNSCRVMNNQKNGKKQKFTATQRNVLFNVMMEKINLIGSVLVSSSSTVAPEIKVIDEPMFNYMPKSNSVVGKTFQQHMNEIADLDTEYERKSKYEEINASESLTKKEKELLILNMQQAKF